MSALRISARASGVRFAVRVVVRASRSELAGVLDGALRVRLAAAPVDGAANEELVSVVARALRVPSSAVRIAAGANSRSKTLDVAGVDVETAQRALTGTANRPAAGTRNAS